MKQVVKCNYCNKVINSRSKMISILDDNKWYHQKCYDKKDNLELKVFVLNFIERNTYIKSKNIASEFLLHNNWNDGSLVRKIGWILKKLCENGVIEKISGNSNFLQYKNTNKYI